MKKRLVALLLAGTAVMMTACGSSASTTQTSDTTGDAAATETADAGAEADSAESDWTWDRDIEMVCVFDVGSGTDVTLREICPLVEEKLGVNIVINNVSGGSGLTGMEYFYQQPADGYTYAMLTPTAVIKGVTGEASFDVQNEIVPVCCLVQDSNIVFSNVDLPYSTWDEFVEYAKANPGVATMTLQSITGIDALSAQQLFEQAGIEVTLVAADGAEAYSLVIGGHADMTLGSACDGQEYVAAGQLNPLIIINTERSSVLPDVPCSADYGMTADLGPWRAVMAKAGTPQGAIDSLEAAFIDVMDNDASWTEWKENNGLNDRDGQFTQSEMDEVWNNYFDIIAELQ